MKIIDPYKSDSPWEAKSWEFTQASSDYISAGTNIAFFGGLGSGAAADCSLSFWAYFNSTGAVGSTYTFIGGPGFNFDRHFALILVNWASPDYNAGTWVADTWYHFVLTYEQATFTSVLYIDKVAVTPNVDTTQRGLSFRNMGISASSLKPTNGYMAEIGFYNKILNQTEVDEIFDKNVGKLCDLRTLSTEPNLMHYYSAHAGDETTVTDLGGYGTPYDLTYQGSMDRTNNVTGFVP